MSAWQSEYGFIHEHWRLELSVSICMSIYEHTKFTAKGFIWTVFLHPRNLEITTELLSIPEGCLRDSEAEIFCK